MPSSPIRARHDPNLIAIEALTTETRAMYRERRGLGRAIERTVAADETPRLANGQELAAAAEWRQSKNHSELADVRVQIITEADVCTTYAEFDPVWDGLSSQEKSRLLQLLIERVDHNGQAVAISVAFHATGIKTLAIEVGQ